MVSAALQVNAGRMDALVSVVASEVPLPSATVAVFGLAYKAGSDTMRRSPALDLIARLRAERVAVRAYDALTGPSALPPASGATFFDDPYEAAAGCQALIVLQDGLGPDALPAARLGAVMPGGLLVDCWNAYEPAAVRAAGLRHLVLGRPLAAAVPR